MYGPFQDLLTVLQKNEGPFQDLLTVLQKNEGRFTVVSF